MDVNFSEAEQKFFDEIDLFIRENLPSDWALKPISWPHDYAFSGYENTADEKLAEAFVRKIIERGWYTAFWDDASGDKKYTNMQQAIFDERGSERAGLHGAGALRDALQYPYVFDDFVACATLVFTL